MNIGTIFRHFFTGRDNQSFELGRALWALGTIAMIVYQGVAIWYKGQPFSPTEFGIGFGSILAAGGVGIAAKDAAGKPKAPLATVENAETVQVKQ